MAKHTGPNNILLANSKREVYNKNTLTTRQQNINNKGFYIMKRELENIKTTGDQYKRLLLRSLLSTVASPLWFPWERRWSQTEP